MRSYGIKSLLVLAAATFVTISAYDIGCIYPPNVGDPFKLRGKMASLGVAIMKEEKLETPMVVHTTHYSTLCQASCLAHHDLDVLNPLTNKPTVLNAPEFGRNAFSIAMCSAQCMVHVFPFQERMLTDLRELGLDVDIPRQDIKVVYDQFKEGNRGPAINLLIAEDYHPYTVGHFLGFDLMHFYETDGWNGNGKLQYSKATNTTTNCTGSCRYYQDTIGYNPVPNPRTYPPLSNDTSKYDCTGLCRRWQPLQQGDDAGSLRQQEFVVPHIGTHAHTFLREPTLTLSDPEYDLYLDSLQVIEEVKITSGDEYRKKAVQIMDDKLAVRAIIQISVRSQFIDDQQMSFQDWLMYLLGISTVEYDGVIQTWHEKVKHDLVRPTTIIKHWDNDILNTFGGEVNFDGPVDIAARDFEAFIRVMPHSEFPSGSSCLCTTYMEFTDLYLNSKYNSTITDFTQNGLTFANMEELRDVCSQSRIWGGMHYPEAVPAGEQICEGLGTLGLDYVNELKNGAAYFNPHYYGQPLPSCPP